MALIMSHLQGRELKSFSCMQVQDNLLFIIHIGMRRTLCVFSSYVNSMNHMYAYSRDRKIEFRMVSAQHFINEALGEDLVPELADEAEEE